MTTIRDLPQGTVIKFNNKNPIFVITNTNISADWVEVRCIESGYLLFIQYLNGGLYKFYKDFRMGGYGSFIVCNPDESISTDLSSPSLQSCDVCFTARKSWDKYCHECGAEY